MIHDFADQGTADIYNGEATKAALRTLAKEGWKVAKRKLDVINAANAVLDLRAPPGNQLEALKGDLKGYFSIRINDQFRIVFSFDGGQAKEVRITDYH